MRCEEARTQLTALLDGELAPEAAGALKAHLAVCVACSQARDEMQAALEIATAWQVEGGDVLATVQQQILQDDIRSLLPEMKRLQGEVAALRAEVAELKSQIEKRETPAERGSSVLRFPYATARDVTRPLVYIGHCRVTLTP